MKIVVIGTGKVGSVLIEQLTQEGHQIVAIDRNEKKLMDLQNSFDVLCLAGNAADRKVLLEAGVGTADLVIAATNSDEVNMLCCLLAKKLGTSHTIARVRKHELADEIDMFAEDMGLSMTINPELYAAQEIFSVLRFPGLMSVESFGHGLFQMVEFRLSEDGPATSMTLNELSRKYNSKALVCAIRRDGNTVIPDGNATLKAGDFISFAAEPKETEHFLKLCGIKSRMPKHVIIIGAGMITYYLIRMMREVGMKPVVIENNQANAETLNQAIPKVLIINADGTDRDILGEEGLDSADAFIALTGTDEINMLMGMYAFREGVPKVVTKVSKSSMLDLIDMDRVGSVVCPRDIVASRIISYVRAKENAGGSDVETLYRIAQGTAEALEFVVHEEHGSITGTPLKDLKTRDGVIICAILRKGAVIIPRGDDTIEQGDHVVIATTIKQLSDLSMILH
ncbi:MAG: Trk system potassium transporter TrkA [Clostridiales bacterium]|nr:Trk system potassium transporter TrkA [Clostridiales bacterium]